MRVAGLMIGFLAVTLFVLPQLPAQEKDKKADKDAKAEAKDPDKAEMKEKEKKPAEEKLEHGPVIPTRILSMKPDSAHDFTVEIPQPDPQQMFQLQQWQAQQMMYIAQSRNPTEYAQRTAQFQQGMAQRIAQGAGYTKKPVDVRARDDCKVRMMNPPVEYDDAGNLKKWTKKELDKLKDKSKLPGYPANFDMLKTGQFVQIYLAKPPPAPKDKGGTKKKKDEDPPEPMGDMRPEVVMIVIWGEPMR
jgi:hypothetical protein